MRIAQPANANEALPELTWLKDGNSRKIVEGVVIKTGTTLPKSLPSYRREEGNWRKE